MPAPAVGTLADSALYAPTLEAALADLRRTLPRAYAAAPALDPRLLFLDEPSAGLDPVTSAELDQLILSLRDVLGATIVIVTHELPSIYSVADRCVMLDRRRRTIVAEGRPADLRDASPDPLVRAFFRREAPAAGAARRS